MCAPVRPERGTVFSEEEPSTTTGNRAGARHHTATPRKPARPLDRSPICPSMPLTPCPVGILLHGSLDRFLSCPLNKNTHTRLVFQSPLDALLLTTMETGQAPRSADFRTVHLSAGLTSMPATSLQGLSKPRSPSSACAVPEAGSQEHGTEEGRSTGRRLVSSRPSVLKRVTANRPFLKVHY